MIAFLQYAILELASYDVLMWCVFILIALCASRFGRVSGGLCGHLVVAVLVCILDIRWIRSEMYESDWVPNDGPDMDIIFAIGVGFRVALVNMTLLPLSFLGLYLGHRRSAAVKPPNPSMQSEMNRPG